MAKIKSIGRAEMEVLRFITDQQSATVSEVADHLAKTKGQTRNTAHNMMERLRIKGYLKREKADGVFRYSPQETKGALLENMVEDFVQTVLGGSISPIVAYLTQKGTASEAEMDEIRKILDSMEKDSNA